MFVLVTTVSTVDVTWAGAGCGQSAATRMTTTSVRRDKRLQRIGW
jgi:hypothetical protein